MKKKIILAVIVLITSTIALVFFYKRKIVYEVSRLSPTLVSDIIKPNSVEELQNIIRSTNNSISFAGGRFSQGGQTAYPGGLVIDTTNLNKITNFDPDQKTITLQPGIKWKDVQKYIDPYNLSIQVMQSYNDFTVGGSLSVNVHSRDLLGSIIKTVKSIKIIMADGSIKTASRQENVDLFDAAIGGYGLLGPIIEATIELTDNNKIERVVEIMDLEKYSDYFFNNIYNNKKVAFHNANIYPNEFKELLAITWYTTDKPVTTKNRLQEKGLYLKEKIEEQLLRRFSPIKKLRQQIEPKRLREPAIVWRNYEMSYSVESLEPIVRFPTTTILQEYFVPVKQLLNFINKFVEIVDKNKINMINVSIRYVAADKESILSYAPEDSFALVCYINVIRSINQNKIRSWTRELINASLSVGGTFYLPYHLYSTKDQFQKAYPKYNEFLDIKKKYDPTSRFINSLCIEYLTC